MRRHITFLCGSLLLVGLAGCGSDSAAAPEPDREGALKFAQCMRENGVTGLEDPTFDENGELSLNVPENIDEKTLDAAHDKCARHLPDGGAREQMNPEDREKVQAFARCVRENGLPEFPDPEPDGGLTLGDIDPDSPEMKAAHEKCAHELPGDGGAMIGSPGGGGR